MPLLQTPDAEWDRPILCTFTPNNHSLRSTDFHYIRYSDGSEELYNVSKDSHEWHNLAGDLGVSTILDQFRSQLPKTNAPPVRSDWNGSEIPAWENAEKNARARGER